MKYSWQIKHYNELTINEFHDLIALRINVFVVEQNCPYPELDGKDKKSYHAIGRDGMGNIIATARILPAGVSYDEVAIGRVVSSSQLRGQGLGHQLMNECQAFIEDEFGVQTPIRLSAQKHLENFYGQHGYNSTGKEYLEDGIPHVEMLKK
ncbi:MAG: GNAT family N-acetyltransferase [Flavobacteriia bacterium]|jgi:ElaA protein